MHKNWSLFLLAWAAVGCAAYNENHDLPAQIWVMFAAMMALSAIALSIFNEGYKKK